jgi:hypothetical protein
VARSVGSFCSLLLIWLCAMGAAPARRPATGPFAIRGAAELALRDVVEMPRLTARLLVERTASPRSPERDAMAHRSWFMAPHRAPAQDCGVATRTTLANQTVAHAERPRWRTYDAAAPPALSRIAR